MNDPTEDELVPVMVPKRLLAAVYGFIAAREQSSSQEEADGSVHRGWTAQMILELYSASSNRMRALLDVLASQPGKKLYIEDFMTVLGADKPDLVNGVLGSFARLTKHRFATRLPDGGTTSLLNVSKDVRDGRWSYEMPPSVADVIKSAQR